MSEYDKPNRQSPSPNKQEPTQCRPHKEDGEILLMEAMLRTMSGEAIPEGSNLASEAIYASEARGQQEMIRSESLPSRNLRCTDADLEAMGIELGPPFDEDPLFRPALIPDGWTRDGTAHNMWSEILDERGRKRLRVFYKAAFHDRAAHVSAETRFASSTASVLHRYDPNDHPDDFSARPGEDDCVVLDYGKGEPPAVRFRAVVSSRPDTPPTCDDTPEREGAWQAYWKSQSEARTAADEWLDEHYPDWKSPAAYWDEE